MNERIKELAEEAVNAVQSRPNGICDMSKYNQKFAELIIQECATMFQLTHTDEQYPRRIDKTILKHFGIIE
jgi:hypothetical protein